MPQPVIIHGNPPDGFTVHGPFENLDEAIAWAESHLDEGEDGSKFFWPVPLYAPDEEPPE